MGGVEGDVVCPIGVEAAAEAIMRSDCCGKEGGGLIGCTAVFDGDPPLANPHFVGEGRQMPGTATGADGRIPTGRWITPAKADPYGEPTGEPNLYMDELEGADPYGDCTCPDTKGMVEGG
eukprot:3158730-Pyramimonas_sp.AAC.1